MERNTHPPLYTINKSLVLDKLRFIMFYLTFKNSSTLEVLLIMFSYLN